MQPPGYSFTFDCLRSSGVRNKARRMEGKKNVNVVPPERLSGLKRARGLLPVLPAVMQVAHKIATPAV